MRSQNVLGFCPRMRSKGSRFTLVVWGLRVCSLDVAQRFATVRNRPRKGRMAVPMVSSAKEVIFGALKRRVASFRVACRGTSWHSDVFRIVWKVIFLCGKSNTFLRRFQKMRCSFSWQATLWSTSPSSPFSKVSKQVVLSFCLASVALCDIPINLFENVSKVIFYIFCGRRNTFESLSQDDLKFFVASAALWKPPSSFCVAGAALETCRVACFVRIAMSGLREVSQRANSLADMALACCDMRWTLRTPYSTLHTLLSTLYNLQSTLYTLHSTHSLHTPHFTLYLHFTLHTLHFTLRHCTLDTLHSTLCTHTLHLYTPHIWHSTVYTLHSALHTPHSTLYTPELDDATLTLALYSLHFTHTLYNPHSTLYTPHFTLYTPHFTLYTSHSTLFTLALHTPALDTCTLHTLHFTLHTLHSTLYTTTLYTLHFTLHTLHFTLHTLHFTLHTLHLTLYTPHSTLHTLDFTLYTQHSTLHTLHFRVLTVYSALVR